MRVATCVLALLVAFVGAANKSQADLVFRLAQTSPSGDLVVGMSNAATFSIFVSSTVSDQLLSGIDMTLSLSSATGAGGRMVAGSNNLLPVSSNPAGWFAGTFDAPGAVEALYSTSAAPAITLPSAGTESLVATVTLSTVGATEGTYSVTLKDLLALNAGFLEIPSSPASQSINYTISAVPEPSSMALAGIALAGVGYRLRRRRS